MNDNKKPRRGSAEPGLFGCILLSALLITIALALAFGAFLSGERKNPIENLMLAIRDGFTTAAEPEPDDEWEDYWGDDEEDVTDEELVTTTEAVTDPPVTAEVTTEPPVSESDAEVTTEGETQSVITVTTEDNMTAPKTTKAPETDPPITNPPATEPPVTDPPVTEPPAFDPDRVNDPDYFKDALFIGDSRTVGLATYGRIDGATYFGRTAMNVGNVFADKKSETEKSGLNLEQLLSQYRFGKIYILLGINEIGYSYSWITSRYEKVVNKIRELQPNAIIIIQSNMHVTKAKSDANPDSFNNGRIDELNRRLAAMADNKTVFYADLTSAFDDASGAMNPDYTGDGVHLRAKYYDLWRSWLLEYGKR